MMHLNLFKTSLRRMKVIFKTYWWGSEIIAENDIDNDILVNLNSVLPFDAKQAYEEGEREISREGDFIKITIVR